MIISILIFVFMLLILNFVASNFVDFFKRK